MHPLIAVALLLAFSLPAEARLRDLGIKTGVMSPGSLNAITDVAGVKVGHTTLIRGKDVRTGVTAVIPRNDVWSHKVFAATFDLNGNGELTGTHWINEAGWLEVPILLTSTMSVPRVADGLLTWMLDKYPAIGLGDDVVLPVVGECDDGWLNNQRGRHVRPEDAVLALNNAKSGPVEEGGVGAGTGMVTYEFKGGIGTASRVLSKEDGGYTVGVLVNSNMERRDNLVIHGVPVGREIKDLMPVEHPPEGSIIGIIATDAPLMPSQLERLARRAPMGMARTGAGARHGSGDLFIAFSTANTAPKDPTGLLSIQAVPNQAMNPLFMATIEATEEAILNALVAGKTTTGFQSTIHALPHDRLKTIMKRYGRL